MMTPDEKNMLNTRLKTFVSFIVVFAVSCGIAVPLTYGEGKVYQAGKYPGELGQTYVEIDGQVYGAQANDVGPIGGGKGYTSIVTAGDYTVSTGAQLIEALAKAKRGETVFVGEDAEIDLSVRVRAEDFVLVIPGGVTLASNRGYQGSSGGLIYSDEFQTRPMIRAVGDKIRITGLRLRGPDPKLRMEIHRRSFRVGGPGHELYYKFPTSDGIITEHKALEVDNCELYGWSLAAVNLENGSDHHIHHNHIHHNQRHGLGYGVFHNTAFSLVEYNLFDNNRHSIAGTGRSRSGYEARHNVVLEHANGHLYDMHGGRDRKDGTDIAGTWMKIHNNTFVANYLPAIVIRGVPEKGALIYNNWFYIPEPGRKVIQSMGNTQVSNNIYGNPPQKIQEHYEF